MVYIVFHQMLPTQLSQLSQPCFSDIQHIYDGVWKFQILVELSVSSCAT